MKKLLTSILFIFFAASAWSQSVASLCNNYCDYNNTNTILADHDTIWVGTGGGLIKQTTSGTILSIYNTANSGLANNYVSALAIDSAGGLLVGTASQGLQRFDRHGTWVALLTAIVATSLCYEVNAIAVNGSQIWVAINSSYNPLFYFDGNNWTYYNNTNSILPYNSAWTIQKDGNDIWIGGFANANGAFFVKVSGNAWTLYDHSHGLPVCVRQPYFAVAPGHKIWMIGQLGVVSYDGTTFDTTTYNHGFISYVGQVYYGNSTIWVSADGGFWQLTGTTWSLANYTTWDNQAARLKGFTEDQNSQVWLSTNFGIYRKDIGSWTSFDYSTLSIVDAQPAAIAEDGGGAMYIGTYTGLSKLKNGNWSCPLKGQIILGLSRSPDGATWVGSFDSGIYRIDTAGVIQPKYYRGGVYDIVASDDTTLWMVDGAINRFTPNTNTSLGSGTTANIWPCVYRYCDKDAHGNIWFAGDSGLVAYDGSVARTFSYAGMGGNSYTYPVQLGHDASGGEYFLSADQLFYYNGTNWSTILPDNDSTIPPSAMLVDHHGNLWVSGGFSLYERTGTTWSRFNLAGPLGGGSNQLYQDHEGNIWVGYGFALGEICASDLANGIKPVNDDPAIAIYPNPANTSVHFKAQGSEDYPLSIDLTDLQGQVVGSFILADKESDINISQVPDGLYIVGINTASHKASYSKLIISR